MSNWDDEDDHYCTAAQDYQDARAVAAELAHPAAPGELRARVSRAGLCALPRRARAGRTPNPDVLCNREIKFGVGLHWARRLGATHFATGHYARLERTADGTGLFKARDAAKDQSYFLHGRAARGASRGAAHAARRAAQGRGARACPPRRACPCTTSPTAPASASSASVRSASSSARYLASDARRRSSPPTASSSARHAGLAFYTLGQRAGLDIGGRARPRRGALVRRGQGRRAQRAHRGAGPRSPAAVEPRARQRPLALAGARAPRRRSAAGVKVRYRQADQAARLQPRADGSVHVALRAAAAGGDAGSVRGRLRGRALSRAAP